MPNYPNLPEGFETKLRAIEFACGAENGDLESYLGSNSGCPYSPDAKRFLRKMLGKDVVRDVGEEEIENPFRKDGMDEVDRFDLLLEEVELTIAQMRDLEKNMNGDAVDHSDRVAVLKAKTALLEKWVNLKDRVITMREMADFQRIVIKVLDEVVSVDQRAEVITRLKDLKSVAGLAI